MKLRTRRSKRVLTVATFAVLAACAAYAYWWFGRTPVLPISQATAVTLFTFREDDDNWERELSRRITDAATVRDLAAKVELRSAPDCACDHFQRLVFDTPGGPVKTSVCGHCFDVQGWGHYDMPPELWKALAPLFEEMEKPPKPMGRQKRAP